MNRGIVAGALAALLGACSPSGLLNGLDRAVGGGAGVDRLGQGIKFGDHGQRLDVWRKPAQGASKRPVLVFFYGGGWVSGARDQYGFAARAFADNGFVVVVPDYRKVPQIRFPAFVVDAAQAVAWTRANAARFGGDPDRIVLAGHSAGAYAVAMLALDRRWLVEEGVPDGTVKAGVGLSGPYDFFPFTSQRAVDAMYGVADPQTTQPIRFARRDAPPLLLVTSSDDTVVRPHNAVNLGKKLEELGASVEVRNYDGMSHEEVVMALSRPFRGKAPVLADSVAFLERSLEREP